jgi:hypothetical protein
VPEKSSAYSKRKSPAAGIGDEQLQIAFMLGDVVDGVVSHELGSTGNTVTWEE